MECYFSLSKYGGAWVIFENQPCVYMYICMVHTCYNLLSEGTGMGSHLHPSLEKFYHYSMYIVESPSSPLVPLYSTTVEQDLHDTSEILLLALPYILWTNSLFAWAMGGSPLYSELPLMQPFGTNQSILIRGVDSFQGGTCTEYTFQGSRLEGVHCILKIPARHNGSLLSSKGLYHLPPYIIM